MNVETRGERLVRIEGKVAHVYTRAQAIDAGELVDVSHIAGDVGFMVPVAISNALHTTVERSCALVDLLQAAHAAIVLMGPARGRRSGSDGCFHFAPFERVIRMGMRGTPEAPTLTLGYPEEGALWL